MSWARFDDCYTEHPKIVAAGPDAELLDMRAILYCARYETDGHIPREALTRLGVGIPAAKAKARKLVEVGRWADTDAGFEILDFLDYNPSKAQRDTEREWNARRRELYTIPGLTDDVKARDGDRCRYCGCVVSWKDRRNKDRSATYDHVIPRGPNVLENIVVACRTCNSRKGARTPEEAGMPLLDPPSNQFGTSSELDTNKPPSRPHPQVISNSSSNSFTTSAGDPDDDKRFVEILQSRIVKRMHGRTIANPAAYAQKIDEELTVDDERTRRLCAEFPDAPATVIAAHLDGEANTLIRYRRQEQTA